MFIRLRGFHALNAPGNGYPSHLITILGYTY
jgi:hypothetical protein